MHTDPYYIRITTLDQPKLGWNRYGTKDIHTVFYSERCYFYINLFT